MRINANQHHAENRARLAGVSVGRDGWLALSATNGLDGVMFSIKTTPKRATGGLSEGGVPSS